MCKNNQEKLLMKGNDAIAEAAVRAGCGAYFGYPITPQNELIARMADLMLQRGRVFIQAESEVAAINMVFGASAAGARAMTSSSSPGISLKQEGLSYAAGADIPLVVVNVARGGPGLGSIAASQSDYFQATRGGGHGDYYSLVLAPKSVQECAELTYLAFDLADQYRMPVMVLLDGIIGQMMEGVVLPRERSLSELPPRDWTVGNRGKTGRESRHLSSLELIPEEMEARTRERFSRYETIKATETRFEALGFDQGPVDLVLVAYGTSARVCLGAKQQAHREGLKVGLFRPITLWPFPGEALARHVLPGTPVLTVEMSLGQLVEDVQLSLLGKAPVTLLGHCGGVVPTEEEVFARAKGIIEKKENRRHP
ncbi:MAG: 3-methyl-2-oxobutanoate dehydrogenase subunit VorB [Spirochaetaceae bacterium]|jgi:2-oxoglutarate ferredoxin oxidoreductase subunit alpha|nr:3-methyl-2-oxobutanoate dehydrogenase subunit VorB [Spirochaetaceae bacterium]